MWNSLRELSPPTSVWHQKKFYPLLKEWHLKKMQSILETHADETQILTLHLWISTCTFLGSWTILATCLYFRRPLLSHLPPFFLLLISLNRDAQVCAGKVSKQPNSYINAVCCSAPEWCGTKPETFQTTQAHCSELACQGLAQVWPWFTLSLVLWFFLSNVFLVPVLEMWECF